MKKLRYYEQSTSFLRTKSDGITGIYVSDYERWLRHGKKTKQNPEDWD